LGIGPKAHVKFNKEKTVEIASCLRLLRPDVA